MRLWYLNQHNERVFTLWKNESLFESPSWFCLKNLQQKWKAWLFWNADNWFCIYFCAFNKSLNNKSPHASSVFHQRAEFIMLLRATCTHIGHNSKSGLAVCFHSAFQIKVWIKHKCDVCLGCSVYAHEKIPELQYQQCWRW